MTDSPLPRVVISDDTRRECERKGVTDPETLHNLAMFETFLAHAGPAAPLELAVTEGPDAVRAWHAEHLTPEQRAFRKAAFADPEWREWLGLPPKPNTDAL